jgi:hypothetical protein
MAGQAATLCFAKFAAHVGASLRSLDHVALLPCNRRGKAAQPIKLGTQSLEQLTAGMTPVKMSAEQTVKNLADMLAVKPDAVTDWSEFFQVRTCSRGVPLAKPCQLSARLHHLVDACLFQLVSIMIEQGLTCTQNCATCVPCMQ